MPLMECVLDHPDRETNPLASSPGMAIWDESQEKTIFYEKEFVEEEEGDQKVEKSPMLPMPPVDQGPSMVQLYEAESQKNVVLMNKNKELRMLLERSQVGRFVMRRGAVGRG